MLTNRNVFVHLCSFLATLLIVRESLAEDTKARLTSAAGDKSIVFELDKEGTFAIALYRNKANDALVRLSEEPLELRESVHQLSIADENLSERGAAEIASFPKLGNLTLSEKWDDSWKGVLPQLNELQHLSIRRLQLGDGTLDEICKIKSLQSLMAEGNTFSKKSLQSITKLQNLQQLSLTGKHIDDAAIEFLKLLPELRYLYLTDTSVSDEGAESLTVCKHLEIVSFKNSKVTAAGAARLKERLAPGAWVVDGKGTLAD